MLVFDLGGGLDHLEAVDGVVLDIEDRAALDERPSDQCGQGHPGDSASGQGADRAGDHDAEPSIFSAVTVYSPALLNV